MLHSSCGYLDSIESKYSVEFCCQNYATSYSCVKGPQKNEIQKNEVVNKLECRCSCINHYFILTWREMLVLQIREPTNR